MMDFDLKEVFSILDENHEGQIQLRRFVDVANNYYSDAEQLARITKALDPKNTGLINFNQFCHGINQISSLQGVSLKDVASDLTRFSRENSLVEDLDQRSLNQDGSTTTFNEYDVDSDELTQKNPSKKSPRENSKGKSFSSALDSSISFGDEEEFSGVAEADSSDLIYPRISPISKRNPLLQPIYSSDEQLQETVEDLQKQVDSLADDKHDTIDRLAKIQSENSALKRQLDTLVVLFRNFEEEQTRSSEQIVNHTRKNQSDIRDKEILETSIMRINAIENELKQTQTVNGQMERDVRQLKNKLEDVDIQLQQSEVRCNDLAEDNEQLLEQLRKQREELKAEKLANAQLIEQLTMNSSEHMLGQTLYRTENLIKTSEIRLQDLDAQVRGLKLENEKLKQENEELKERTVFEGFNEGRLLMANRDSFSYAAELEFLSKDELMSKLREQFMVNERLREYVERMLNVIIENNPQLLETTMNSDMPIRMVSSPSVAINQETKTSDKRDSISDSTPTPSSQVAAKTATNKSNDKYCRLS